MKPGRRKYSDAQNAAVVDGVLVDRLSPAEVAARAAAGTLRAGVEPFEIPWRTVQDKAGDARREAETRELAAADGDAALGAIAAQIVAGLRREANRLDRATRHGRAKPEQWAALAKAAREAAGLRRELERGKPRGARGGSSPASEAPADDDWIADVAATADLHTGEADPADLDTGPDLRAREAPASESTSSAPHDT